MFKVGMRCGVVAVFCVITNGLLAISNIAPIITDRELKLLFVQAYNKSSSCILKNRFAFQGGFVDSSGDEECNPFGRLQSFFTLCDLVSIGKEEAVGDHVDVVGDEKAVVLGKWFIDELRVLVGDRWTPHKNFVARIDRTCSVMGMLHLCRLITHPTLNLSVIGERQKFIQELEQNTLLRSNLRSMLLRAGSTSVEVLSLWSKNSLAMEALSLLGSYFPKNGFMALVLPENLLNQWGKSSVGGPAYSFYNLVCGDIAGLMDCLESLLDGILTLVLLLPEQKRGAEALRIEWNDVPRVVLCSAEEYVVGPWRSLLNVMKRWSNFVVGRQNASKSDSVLRGNIGEVQCTLAMLKVGLGAYNSFVRICKVRKAYIAVKMAHGALVEIAGFVKVCNELDAYVTTSCKNFQCLKQLSKLHEFVNAVNNSELKSLISIVMSNTFSSKRDFSLISFVPIIRALALLNDNKQAFIAALEAVGEIDAYYSLATLCAEHRLLPNGYCYTEFVDKELPYLRADSVWDSFINPVVAVANSVELGKQGDACHAIISGPNKGGKSTFMRSVMSSILLSQTVGIASSKQFVITPYGYLDSCGNVEDEAGQKSKFESESDRVAALIDNLKVRQSGVKSFIIVDEMFNGTNSLDASCASCAIAIMRIAKLPQTLWLISTHLSALKGIEAETQGLFANYYVEIKRNADGSLEKGGYTFRILKGVTNETTAFDVLKQSGIGDDVIEVALKLRERRLSEYYPK